ncbi:outer membrane protein assembly factor BamD [Arenibacter sp. GZD96]|uniref:outer membrane protein assembly factor BamD n=1 Tax=Aurantibrevibacter litoralis TaxID=3106030 RepID=UPI002AFEC0B7|nr:outer membrane protein assembly factor BamD [Arenibacter sp. GZD-96]MEA1786345.1 outer membrane protein assembly factor BamD [Arenibacter sp. GZD-96]
MRTLLPLLLLLFILSSCSEYQKVLKNEDIKAKYDLAEKLYTQGDYKRSNRLFEQIAPQYIGKPQGERVTFFFADSYYKIGSYNLAGYQFERFIKSYPKSDKIQDASFLGAKSYYMLSPRYSLDQTDTDKALQKMQLFINMYPDSEFMTEANRIAKELTQKKEKKAFEIAKQFNTLGEFDYSLLISAIAALDNFISDFPGSIYREEALYYRFEAYARRGLNSFDNKKEERFIEARAAYSNLIKYFPETKFAKKSVNLLDRIEKESKLLSEAAKEANITLK